MEERSYHQSVPVGGLACFVRARFKTTEDQALKLGQEEITHVGYRSGAKPERGQPTRPVGGAGGRGYERTPCQRMLSPRLQLSWSKDLLRSHSDTPKPFFLAIYPYSLKEKNLTPQEVA